ncbi:MAG: dTDP-4-dehydrorhamnose 3,5-epimerase [Bacteroidaceae bacterium]|nr:dTDP-4-dehydrorhamnose 3,5-epimerase [Bacteroidaceae bacterium]
MRLIETKIPGVVVVEPKVFHDDRGYFFESFSDRDFNEQYRAILGNPADYEPVVFVQDNESMSSYGVMRGLHFQCPPYAQAKLVRCIEGSVLDVAVDIRKSSPTYGQWVAQELTGDNHLQFFIPRGFAHGFAVLTPTAMFLYKCDNLYNHASEGGLSIMDEQLGIDWRIPVSEALLSEKDKHHPTLRELSSPFVY